MAVAPIRLRDRVGEGEREERQHADGKEGQAIIDDVERGKLIGEYAERSERGAENQTSCDNDSQGLRHGISGSLTANAAKDGREV
jgi:hypothetical protein